jgi:hypothetical protein
MRHLDATYMPIMQINGVCPRHGRTCALSLAVIGSAVEDRVLGKLVTESNLTAGAPGGRRG